MPAMTVVWVDQRVALIVAAAEMADEMGAAVEVERVAWLAAELTAMAAVEADQQVAWIVAAEKAAFVPQLSLVGGERPETK